MAQDSPATGSTPRWFWLNAAGWTPWFCTAGPNAPLRWQKKQHGRIRRWAMTRCWKEGSSRCSFPCFKTT